MLLLNNTNKILSSEARVKLQEQSKTDKEELPFQRRVTENLRMFEPDMNICRGYYHA